MQRTKGTAWAVGVAALMGAVCLSAFAHPNPAESRVVWPPWKPDVDPTTPGDQPGYDVNHPLPPGATKDMWKVIVAVKPPTNADGTPRRVCDAHFIFPPGMKVNSARVSETTANLAPVFGAVPGGQNAGDPAGYHFYSPNCDQQQMPPAGLTFVFSTDGMKDPKFRDITIRLTDDSQPAMPEPTDPHTVGILYNDKDGHPLKMPFVASLMSPGSGGVLASIDGVAVVSAGQSVSLSLVSTFQDVDYKILSSRFRDSDGTDSSESGIRAVSDPIPPAWGVTVTGGERWLNSFGLASAAVAIPSCPAVLGQQLHFVAQLSSGESSPGLSTIVSLFVAHSPADYDGDTYLNAADEFPLDPTQH